jgi:hypothetical protein
VVATEETKFQVTTVCANAATAHDCDWSITRVGFPDLEIMINEQVAEEQKSKASDAMIVSVQIRSSQKPSQRDFCAAIN